MIKSTAASGLSKVKEKLFGGGGRGGGGGVLGNHSEVNANLNFIAGLGGVKRVKGKGVGVRSLSPMRGRFGLKKAGEAEAEAEAEEDLQVSERAAGVEMNEMNYRPSTTIQLTYSTQLYSSGSLLVFRS